jgi:hypothetical protein
MDDSDDSEDLQINFDMLMPDLVCQFASIDVSDMMGTNRQGITKNIVMQRVDSSGKKIQRVDYTGDQVLEYESGELPGNAGLCAAPRLQPSQQVSRRPPCTQNAAAAAFLPDS